MPDAADPPLGLDRDLVLFGCGAAKSGTHSLAALFERSHRTVHEPDAHTLCHLLVDLDIGLADRGDLVRYLREKDARLRLEVDANQLNADLVETLVDLYPTSRFVLTVREPLGWLDSFFDHHLARGGISDMKDGWKRLAAHRDRCAIAHSRHDQVLADHGFSSVATRLRAWASRIDRVQAAVPDDRLLVIRTDHLHRVDILASFAGVPGSSLDADASHAFGALDRFGLLARVDQAYLHEQVLLWCQPHLGRLFPELSVTLSGG